MRQLVLGLLFCFSGTCLNASCMLDIKPAPLYEGGTIIKARKYWWGGSVTVRNSPDSDWGMHGLVINPDTKEIRIDTATSTVNPAQAALHAEQMGKYNESFPYQIQRGEQQRQTADEVLGRVVEMTNIMAALVPQVMQLRNERGAAHDAASAANPDLLEQLVQQYLPVLAANPDGAGYNAELQAIKADQFVALAKAKQLQAKNPDDPTVASLVRSLDAALCRCASLKDARTTTDPLAVPGLP